MLIIYHPDSYLRERQYIHHVIFREFLGLEYIDIPQERAITCICSADDDGKKLTISDCLFNTPEDQWLTDMSLPELPLSTCNKLGHKLGDCLVDDLLPVIYGVKFPEGNYIEKSPDEVKLGIDIFGSAFFMLGRYEELVIKERDTHSRFPALTSIALKEGFLNRPVVDEYVEILWQLLSSLWPGLVRKKREFKIIPTHDVDSPFLYATAPVRTLLNSLAGDIIRRKDIRLFINNLDSIIATKRGRYWSDPHFTFPRILDLSEKYGLKSCFYFMTGRRSALDGNYDIEHPLIQNLMKTIHEQGHEIGIHLSYNSYLNSVRIAEEFNALKLACNRIGIDQTTFGGRQHYLRWSVPETWRAYAKAGIAYDTTLTYAEQIGFRCGTCHEYTVFDLKERQQLNLVERPLSVMECSALDPIYMNLDYSSAYREIMAIRNCCRKYNGNFVILWHNSWLVNEQEFAFYDSILRGA